MREAIADACALLRARVIGRGQVEAYNTAERDIHNLLNRWDSMTRTERRTRDRAAAPTIAQITNSAATFNLTLSRLQPEADGSVSVALEQQPFNALAQWLVGIENEQGYTIDRASIDRTNEQGLVNAQLRIR